MKKTFDKEMQELESIVDAIQDKSIGLEESMALFEKGVKLSKECLDFLNETKGHLEDLSEQLKSLDVRDEVEND